ncbi:endonuclease/exonuclease/phosphatase family protein [Micromonospora sp. CA-244673]|uniref:endonuclease/exonuclease/phosphatase family protein n=1 Tax=Micromonospora sp. CA-244673 TaxID=3239958 RepID=UPI003D8DFF5B
MRRPRVAAADRSSQEQAAHLPRRAALPPHRRRTRPRRRLRPAAPRRRGRRAARAPQRGPCRGRRRRAAGQPGMPTILCGDLNDGPDAVTTVLLEGPADGDVNRPDKGDAVRLYNLGRRLPPARAYSRIYQGRGELIDHILATRDLQLRLVGIDSLVDDITSIGASTRSREAVIVPDHAPVIARFTSP